MFYLSEIFNNKNTFFWKPQKYDQHNLYFDTKPTAACVDFLQAIVRLCENIKV